MVKFLDLKNVFATLLAAGGKTRRTSVWTLKMQVNVLEDSYMNLFQENFMNALDQPNLIRINMDTAAATIISVNGTIGEKSEFSKQLRPQMLIFQETWWNASVHRSHIRTNLAIAAVTMVSVNGMIGRKLKEHFLRPPRIKLTNFTQDRLIAMLIKSIRMSMVTVTAGITQEVKLCADTGNFVNLQTRIAF